MAPRVYGTATRLVAGALESALLLELTYFEGESISFSFSSLCFMLHLACISLQLVIESHICCCHCLGLSKDWRSLRGSCSAFSQEYVRIGDYPCDSRFSKQQADRRDYFTEDQIQGETK